MNKTETRIKIKAAQEEDIQVLALLGRITYTESHHQFIEDKNDLLKYNDEAFSISKTRQVINDSKNLIYLIYVNNLPVGYAKLILNETHESVASKNCCRLDKIYILSDFIPLKLGQQFLDFLEKKIRELKLDTIWLVTYVKNHRAIKFYQKNEYETIGNLNFSVNGKDYDNHIFSKNI